MSHIIIKCIKYNDTKEEEYHEAEKYHKDYEKERHIDKNIEFSVEASQLFMSTKDFFNAVKDSLIKYFDEIIKES